MEELLGPQIVETRPAVNELDSLAAAINADHDAGINSAQIRLEYYRSAGERLLSAKEICGHGNWLGFVKRLEFSERTAQNYMRFAKSAPGADLDDEEKNWRKASSKEKSDGTDDGSENDSEDDDLPDFRARGTGENEWYTPQEYVESARTVLGTIDLDPASSEIANEIVQAACFYSKEDDGLTQEWRGRVWMNPPYSQPAIAHFVEKLCESVSDGLVTEAIALTHNYTDTGWFHLAAYHATAICFTRGRIGFQSPDGKRAAPTQGQAFFYYGANPEGFAREFKDHGFVVNVTDSYTGE